MTTAHEISAGKSDDSWVGRRGELAVALVLLAVGLGLRVLACFHHPVKGGEAQCLHVAWCWTQGLLHYRDAADSQMPLFQMLCAPLLRMVGERADVAAMMRLWMLPLFAVALWCVYRIAQALFSRRAALWAVALVSVCPVFFGASLEFRPETLWLALWLWALAILVEGRLTSARSLLAGFVLGTALAVSLKTTLLLLSLGLAGLGVAVMLPRAELRSRLARLGDCGSAAFAGFVVMPAAVAGLFLANDALGAFYQSACHLNPIADIRFWRDRAPACLVLLPLLWWIGRVMVRRAPEAGPGTRRALIFLVCGVYLVLLRPLDSQGHVALFPLLTVLAAPAVIAAARWLGYRSVTPYSRPADAAEAGATGEVEFGLALMRTRLKRWRRVAGDYFGVREVDEGRAKGARWIEVTLMMAVAVVVASAAIRLESPWVNGAAAHRALLAEVFRLAQPGERVMDTQGETVFRRRPFRYLLDPATRELMAREPIADTIPERLVETQTCVVAADSSLWPKRARLFMMKNYLPVGRLRVAGFFLTAPPTATSEARVFDVLIPAHYVVVGETGPVAGTLDSQPMTGAVFLKPGRYAFRPGTPTGRLALFWAPALERGFSPFWK
ncbi:MAG: glycosyltransferase family 39 protein [Verrucomicrobia bacterium]|nr:glycosyltransferase family 39 protein [Verrucomicrobiota bacterium]